MHFVNNFGRPGCKPEHIAVAAENDFRNPLFASEGRMLGQMQSLAVHGHCCFGLEPLIKRGEFSAPRMAGDMHEVSAISDDFYATPDHLVENTVHSLLVARNGARRKNQNVTLVEVNIGMIVAGNARERSPRF